MGLIHDMPDAAYRAAPGLSVSAAKKLTPPSTPAAFRYAMDHPTPPTDAMEFGTIAHAMVLGEPIPLMEVHAVSWQGKEAKAAREKARADGLIALKSADVDKIRDMVAALDEHLTARLVLDGHHEVSLFGADEPTGTPIKGRCDVLSLHDTYIADYKTTAGSASPEEFVRTAINFGYDQQAAWYLDLAQQCGRDVKSFIFVVQEKTAPYSVSVIELDDEFISRGRYLNRLCLDLHAECTETGIWPGYPDETTTISAPNWAMKHLANPHPHADFSAF